MTRTYSERPGFAIDYRRQSGGYPKNFEQAEGLLTGRNSQHRKLGNNTYLERRDRDSIAIRLHSTDIVTFNRDGSSILNSGGWKTSTTKNRINQAGFRVSQDRGIWRLESNGEEHIFADGMKVSAHGHVTGAGKDETKARKSIRKFADRFVKALRAGEVPAPSAGDCFYCGLRTVDGGIPMGEASKDREHILSHLEESYFVPSLILRAVETFGSKAELWTLGGYWGQPENLKAWGSEFMHSQIRKHLTRYIYRQLGMVA